MGEEVAVRGEEEQLQGGLTLPNVQICTDLDRGIIIIIFFFVLVEGKKILLFLLAVSHTKCCM